MIRSTRASGLALAAAMFCVLSGAAHAKPPSNSEAALVRDLVKEATAAKDKGNCEEALQLLEQAVAIKETPEGLLTMGECQVQLGKLFDSVETFEKAEALAEQTKDKGTERAASEKLAEVRAKIPTISLKLPPDLGDVTIKVDGAPITLDDARRPLAVSPGDHSIDIISVGRGPFSKKLTVAPGEKAEVTVVLPPLRRQPEPPRPVPPPRRSEESSDIPAATWFAGGAAVALTVGGIVAFVAAGGKASDAEEACKTQVTCDEGAKDAVHGLDAAALGMWVGAGVGAGLALTFYFVSRPSEPHPSAAPSGPSAGPRARRATPPSAPAAARLVAGPGSLRLEGQF